MITISLTEFIDFTVAIGTSRLTKVKQAKCREAYDPRTDYWKPLREAIVAFHNPANKLGKDAYFKEFLEDVHASKETAYTTVVDNYKKFLGRKVVAKLQNQKTNWTHGKLTVRINPELFLNINGSRELIKLYFKQDKLSKAKTDMILALMNHALPATANADNYAVYDGRNNKIIKAAAPSIGLLVLAQAEAAAFELIWNSIKCEEKK